MEIALGLLAAVACILALVAIGLALAAIATARQLKAEVTLLRLEQKAAYLRGVGAAKAPPAPAAGTPEAAAKAPAVPEVPVEATVRAPVMPAPERPVPAVPGARNAAFGRLTQQPERPPTPRSAAVSEAVAESLSLERILIRVGVGVGGLSLALAGIFLVKVAFDHNLISPWVRVVIGAAFGLVLLGAGVWRRSKEATIAQALSAAGIADLFACFLAATNLYHLISPITGFGLLAATTAVAVGLSLSQGPFVALLGLVGGFLTPALIHTKDPSALSLFGYLLLLHVGLLVITRLRGWWWLALLTILASQAWVALWLFTQPFAPADGMVLGGFLLVATLLAAGSALQEPAWGETPTWARLLGYVALATGLLLAAALLRQANYGTTEWAFLGLLAVACLALARLRHIYEPLAWMAALAVAMVLAGALQHPGKGNLVPEVATFGALFTLGAYGLMWGSRVPVTWATLSAAAAVGYVLLAYFGIGDEPRPASWGWLPAGAAVLMAALTLPVLRRRRTLVTGEDALAALATGALALLAIAPPMVWETALLTAAWAGVTLLAAWAAMGLRVRMLEGMTALLGVLVALRLGLNPMVLGYQTGPSWAWNPLVWAYVPGIVGLLGAAWLMERSARAAPLEEPDTSLADSVSGILQIGATLAALVFVTLMTRLAFHPQRLAELSFELPERATYPLVWFAAALGLLELGWASTRSVATLFGYLALAAAVCDIFLMQVLAANPLWTGEAVGSGTVVNGLLYIYALPAACLGALAWRMARRREDATARTLVPLLGVAALLLLFVLVTLEVRQAFHGAVLTAGWPASAELYTYSAAWALLGTLLLAAGILTRSIVLRWASLAVMLLTIAKVFLVDTPKLSDIFRVLSFAGLGLSLILLGFLYHYFVFRRSPVTTISA